LIGSFGRPNRIGCRSRISLTCGPGRGSSMWRS
jgi:hypothetical protein